MTASRASLVQICCSAGLAGQVGSRISVCDGVNTSRGVQRWISRPADIWRGPTREELDDLEEFGDGEPDLGRAIGLFEMSPVALARSIEFLEWYFASPGRSLPECQTRAHDVALLESIYTGDDAKGIFMGVATGPANRSTVAVHRDTGEAVGLHLDNYDGLPVRERAGARNRICVNVGPQSRYLLFLRFQANFLLAQLEHHDGVSQELRERIPYDHRELVYQYFRLFPDSRVYRIEIRPGEGYIAPTENIVHEGSTLGTQERDFSMVWLGHFRWCSLNAHV